MKKYIAMLFIHLPSGRDLCYAKPRIGENQFGSPAVTYMGVGATKKWERIESYGPKFVENIVQGMICTPNTGHPVLGVFLCDTVMNTRRCASNYIDKENGSRHQKE